jgi:hypothetical protein
MEDDMTKVRDFLTGIALLPLFMFMWLVHLKPRESKLGEPT